MEVLRQGRKQERLETFQSRMPLPLVSAAMLISSLKMRLLGAKTSKPCSRKELK